MRRIRALFVVLVLAGATTARAQEIEPRKYTNAPVGVNFVLAGYGYSTGAVIFDPSIPLENAHLDVNTGLLACARTLGLWGLAANASVLVPYAWLSGSADLYGETRYRDVSGFGDLGMRFTVNFAGSPALSLAEFRSYRQRTIAGASVFVSAPIGQYDPEKVVNIGTNRWFVRPELGLSQALGRWTLELAAAVSLYGDNTDYLQGHTRSQEPVYSVQGGVAYAFSRGIWAAFNGTYFTGGRTSIDGVEGNDLEDNSRAGITLALPVDRRNSVKLFASKGVSTRTGGDYDLFSVLWQYRWGGGT